MDNKQMEVEEEAEKEEEEEEEEQEEEEEGFLSSSQPPLHLPAMCIHNYSPHVMMSLPSYIVYTVMRRNGLPTLDLLAICILLPTYHDSFREGVGGMV